MFNATAQAEPLRVILNEDKRSADLFIYDEISSWWGIGQNEVREKLDRMSDVQLINVHINSPGGDVFEAMGIYRALKEHPATINVRVDGIAASAASFIAMSGDSVVMASRSMMMIHDALSIMWGNAEEFRSEATILDKISGTIAGVYADRAGESVEHWRAQMLAETWYTDDEAVEAGLADSVDRDGSNAIDNAFDLSVFKNVPTRRWEPPSQASIEPDETADSVSMSDQQMARLQAAEAALEVS